MENKEIRNTLEGVLITDKRGSGNTTRQVDAAIQHLFNGYAVKCISHSNPSSPDSNRFLAYNIMRRIELEHPFATCKYNQKDNIIEIL